MPANLENSVRATGLEKVNLHSNLKEVQSQRMFKLPYNCASNVMLKIRQVRLQQYMNQELSDVQAGFRKGRGTINQIANIRWIIEKAREFQKYIYFCFIDHVKAFDFTKNSGKFLERWEYQTTLPASWETFMQVKKQQSELHMEKWMV